MCTKHVQEINGKARSKKAVAACVGSEARMCAFTFDARCVGDSVGAGEGDVDGECEGLGVNKLQLDNLISRALSLALAGFVGLAVVGCFVGAGCQMQQQEQQYEQQQ